MYNSIFTFSLSLPLCLLHLQAKNVRLQTQCFQFVSQFANIRHFNMDQHEPYHCRPGNIHCQSILSEFIYQIITIFIYIDEMVIQSVAKTLSGQ